MKYDNISKAKANDIIGNIIIDLYELYRLNEEKEYDILNPINGIKWYFIINF